MSSTVERLEVEVLYRYLTGTDLLKVLEYLHQVLEELRNLVEERGTCPPCRDARITHIRELLTQLHQYFPQSSVLRRLQVLLSQVEERYRDRSLLYELYILTRTLHLVLTFLRRRGVEYLRELREVTGLLHPEEALTYVTLFT